MSESLLMLLVSLIPTPMAIIALLTFRGNENPKTIKP